jgi:HD-GYP domain-containing protein (c-di-GMP phosphodiesterase class II)
LADVVEVFHRANGTDAAITVAMQRRGTQFDPQVVDIFAAEAASLFADLDEVRSWDAVIAAEPAWGRGRPDRSSMLRWRRLPTSPM